MTKIDFQAARISMVDCQIRPSDVTHYNIIDAMLKVPREIFFPEKLRTIAYTGESIKISDDRCVLDPRLIAKILNLININSSELVLNIGGCYGYLASVLSYFSQAVVILEEPVFAEEAERILVQESIDNVIVNAGPLPEGAGKYGPYDAIIIEGGVDFVPADISDQLKIGGRMTAIFRDGEAGECRIGFKTAEGINWRFGFNAVAPMLKGFKNKAEFIF